MKITKECLGLVSGVVAGVVTHNVAKKEGLNEIEDIAITAASFAVSNIATRTMLNIAEKITLTVKSKKLMKEFSENFECSDFEPADDDFNFEEDEDEIIDIDSEEYREKYEKKLVVEINEETTVAEESNLEVDATLENKTQKFINELHEKYSNEQGEVETTAERFEKKYDETTEQKVESKKEEKARKKAEKKKKMNAAKPEIKEVDEDNFFK